MVCLLHSCVNFVTDSLLSLLSLLSIDLEKRQHFVAAERLRNPHVSGSTPSPYGVSHITKLD